jgi:hypothetical protein
MKILQTNKSKFIALLTIIFLALFSLAISAQEKEKPKSKMDQLKGKVEKITVKVDGKDVVFEGKEAEKLAKQLRGQKRIEIVTDDGEDIIGDSYSTMFRTKHRDNDYSFNVNSDDDNRKIKVEDKDGEKTVTVTTKKDGKEETKTYKGEDAEKFLKDEKGNEHFKFIISDDGDMPHESNMYFKHMDRDDCCCGCGHRMMMRKPFPGKMKHMILKEFDEDDKPKEEKSEKK